MPARGGYNRPSGGTAPSTGSSLWFPDLPPVSANANDDEFSDGALGGAWTSWNNRAELTYSEGINGAKMAHAGHAGDSWAGIFRVVPAGDWSIVTKMSMASIEGGGALAGLFLAEDLAAAPLTGNMRALDMTHDGYVRLFDWNDYTTFGSSVKPAEQWNFGDDAYMRVRRSGATYSWDLSLDGVSWRQYQSGAIGFAVASIGLGINASGGTAATAFFRFYRQVATTVLDTPVFGKAAVPGGTQGTSGVAGKDGTTVFLPPDEAEEPIFIPGTTGAAGAGTPGAAGVAGPAVFLEQDPVEPEPFIVPGATGPASTVAGPTGPAVYLEQDPPESEPFIVPGATGPASTVAGPAGQAVFLEVDPIEPDLLIVPGKDGAKGADGAPGTGGSGVSVWLPGDEAEEAIPQPPGTAAVAAAAAPAALKLFEYFTLT